MGLRMHTHLSETRRYVEFCRERFDMLPVEFVAEHEWLGPDVWFAHLVHLASERDRDARRNGQRLLALPGQQRAARQRHRARAGRWPRRACRCRSPWMASRRTNPAA